MNSNIEENRRKALERIRQRQNAIKANLGQPTLNKEQRMSMIEANRQKALERQRKVAELKANTNKNDQLRDASSKPTTYIKPTIKTKDYIEYDFSTLKNVENGFIVKNDVFAADGASSFKGKTLEEWKAAQVDKKESEEPPPLDLVNAPRCYECKNAIELDKKMLDIFHCKVCKACKEKHPEKYSLLTKTECKEDYFLTEPELADLKLFPRIVKNNPHSGTFSRMQLFLRYQIEEYAFDKWGSAEALDKEWLRREEMKKNRREKRWVNKLKEMRKRLRAEEITKSLKTGDEFTKHKHEWCEPLKIKSEDNLYKKRCVICGIEVEELVF